MVICGGVKLAEGEYSLATVVADGGAGHRSVATLAGGGFVVLDTDATSELVAEGLARDLVRAVQQVRRDAGLAVGDRIRLTVHTQGEQALGAAQQYAELVRTETLAVELDLAGWPPTGGTEAVLGDGSAVTIAVERA